MLDVFSELIEYIVELFVLDWEFMLEFVDYLLAGIDEHYTGFVDRVDLVDC